MSLKRLVSAVKEDLMANGGKKPIERKLEEARAKLFTVESLHELLKPEFVPKAYASTFVCILIGMILNYFITTETNEAGIQEFVTLISSNLEEFLEAEEPSEEMQKQLLLSHPFTHRMVKLLLISGQKVFPSFHYGF